MESSAAFLALPPVTPSFLHETPRGDTAAALRRAECLIEESRYDEAVEALGEVAVPAVSAPRGAVGVLHGEAWARMYLGQLDAADTLCERARALAEGGVFGDDARPEALFRLSACRLKR